jgi:hypothetical protein
MKKKNNSIYIGYDGCWENLNLSCIIKKCKEYLKGFNFIIKQKIFSTLSLGLAEKIATCRITSLENYSVGEPFPAEIDFEYRVLKGLSKPLKGLLYDGFMFQHTLGQICNSPFLFVYITDRLICTMGQDGKYHARTIILGNPAIISTTGLVEGPAKDTSYYRVKSVLSNISPEAEFKLEIGAGKNYLSIDDRRINRIIPGYILQAVFFNYTSEPFCVDKMCRLYNAHWQKEMLMCQLQKGIGLCIKHRKKMCGWIKDC